MTITTIAFVACSFWGFAFLLGSFGLWIMRVDLKQIEADLDVFIDARAWDEALTYIEAKITDGNTKGVLKPMFEQAEAPHRLMMECEEARLRIKWTQNRRSHPIWNFSARSMSLLLWGCMAYTLYYHQPTTMNSIWLVGWLVLAMCGALTVSRIGTVYKGHDHFLVRIRNKILLAQGYIPPELTPRRATQAQLDAWKEGIKEIELQVLAGADWEEATNEQIQRVHELYQHSVEHPDDPLPPSGRLGLLREV